MSFRGMNWGRLAVGLWMASVMRMPAMASSLKLSYGATAGLVQQLSVAALTTPNWFVTGVENAGNNLEVIAWNNNTAASQVQRMGSSTAGTISAVALAPLASDRFVAAVNNGDGFLELIVYAVDGDGNITRQGSTVVAFTIDTLAISALDGSHVVTVTSNVYSLLLTPTETATVWAVDANGNLSMVGSPVTMPNPSPAVAVAGVSSTQFTVAQCGQDIDQNNYPLILSSWAVGTTVWGQELVNAGNLCTDAMQMVSLNDGDFALAFQDLATQELNYGFWIINSVGSMYQAGGNDSIPMNWTLAVANLGGLAFTMSDSAPAGAGSTSLEGNVWYYSTNRGEAADKAFTCGPVGLCPVSAAGLSSTQIAVASAPFVGAPEGNLHVDIWTYAP